MRLGRFLVVLAAAILVAPVLSACGTNLRTEGLDTPEFSLGAHTFAVGGANWAVNQYRVDDEIAFTHSGELYLDDLNERILNKGYSEYSVRVRKLGGERNGVRYTDSAWSEPIIVTRALGVASISVGSDHRVTWNGGAELFLMFDGVNHLGGAVASGYVRTNSIGLGGLAAHSVYGVVKAAGKLPSLASNVVTFAAVSDVRNGRYVCGGMGPEETLHIPEIDVTFHGINHGVISFDWETNGEMERHTFNFNPGFMFVAENLYFDLSDCRDMYYANLIPEWRIKLEGPTGHVWNFIQNNS